MVQLLSGGNVAICGVSGRAADTKRLASRFTRGVKEAPTDDSRECPVLAGGNRNLKRWADCGIGERTSRCTGYRIGFFGTIMGDI